MKIRFMLLAALAAFACLSAAWAAQKATSNTYRVRIRSEAGVSGKILGYLSKGESVSVLQKGGTLQTFDGKRSYWYQVTNSSGVTGWVFGGFLDGVDSAQLVTSPKSQKQPAAAPTVEPVRISAATTEACGEVKSILTSKIFGLKTAVKHGSFDFLGQKRAGCQIFINDVSDEEARILSREFSTALSGRGWMPEETVDDVGSSQSPSKMRSKHTLCVQVWGAILTPGRASLRVDCFDDAPPQP